MNTDILKSYTIDDESDNKIIIGLIKDDTNFIIKSDHYRIYKSDGTYTRINKEDGKEIKMIEALRNNFNGLFEANYVKFFEPTKIEAPSNSKLDCQFHQDSNEFDNGISLLIFPNMDNTIKNGRVIFSSNNFTKEFVSETCIKVNEYFKYEFLSWQFDDKYNEYQILVNGKKFIQGYTPFIIFDGKTLHQFEKLEGTGIQETILFYIDGKIC